MSIFLIYERGEVLLTNSDPFYRGLQVDIGDLRVDFFGTSGFVLPQETVQCPPHFHARHELQYVLSGSLEMSIDEDTSMILQAGTALLVPPNVLHRSIAGEEQRLALSISMHQISANTASPDFSEYQHYCAIFGKLRKPLVMEDDMIKYCVEQLVHLSDTPAEHHKQKCLLSLLFIRLAEHAKIHCREDAQARTFSSAAQRSHQYYTIEHFINTRYSKKTNVEELAQSLHMSRRQTDRIIVQIFGKSFASLILERRMSVAQILLKKTDIPCSEIAEKVGYSSYAGFYIAFKQYFGIAPDEVRRSEQ